MALSHGEALTLEYPSLTGCAAFIVFGEGSFPMLLLGGVLYRSRLMSMSRFMNVQCNIPPNKRPKYSSGGFRGNETIIMVQFTSEVEQWRGHKTKITAKGSFLGAFFFLFIRIGVVGLGDWLISLHGLDYFAPCHFLLMVVRIVINSLRNSTRNITLRV